MAGGLSKKMGNGDGADQKAGIPKILVISDIHGNFEALKALPEDYDELWVLGDLVNYGPQPAEVIDFVRKRAALVVRGNHDDAVAFDRDPRCSPAFRRAAEETRKYTASVLSPDDKAYLAELPYYRWVRRGRWTFYVCHAAPSDPLHVYHSPDAQAWGVEASMAGTDFVFVGHTHIQFTSPVGDQLIVNPGSAGQPKTGGPSAKYAGWSSGSVVLGSCSYPVARTAARIRSMPVSEETKEFLIRVLETGTVPKSTRERVHVKDQRA
ncbi:MAG TPA: metallophosphoesterase family protein [Terriglobales bacterium]|jgi:protein phosphatase|nr:metallophosphoesterase family protein [Terriglobales bacterium]